MTRGTMESLAVIALVLAAVLVVLEVYLRRSRRTDFAREAAEWQKVSEAIQADLAQPKRQEMIREVRRQAEVNRQQLNQLCLLTSNALDAPAAVVTVVEYNGQRWLAYYGADWVGDDVRAGLIAPLNTSYCQYVVAKNTPLAIEDSYKDARVASASERTKSDVRAYLGSPVHTSTGEAVGSLCVFDTKPRKWSVRDTTTLTSMASLVTL